MRESTGSDDSATRSWDAASRLWAIAILASLWWVISGGEPGSWFFGVPAIVLALYVTARAGGGLVSRLRPWPLLRLSAEFLWLSVRGGIDVARRVLSPRLRVRPAVVTYEWRLPESGLRTLMLAIINLQPGTLGVWSDERHLQVHVLDEGLPLAEALVRLEDRVAELVGQELRMASEHEA